MKGLKTVLFGAGLAVVPVALQYLAGIDWTTLVSPTWAPVIVGGVTILLRYFTDTAIGKKY